MSAPRRGPPKSAKELLTRYAAGERDFAHADLSEANLRDAILSGADLSGADLSEANLSGADLSGADLSEANLGSAILGGSNTAHFYTDDRDVEVVLRGTDLARANLTHADLGGANLSSANLREANLSRADLGDAILGGANLSSANLSGACFDGTVLGDVDLSDCDLTDALHDGRSSVGVDTLRATAEGIRRNPGNQGPVEAFFRGCGVPDEAIDLFRTWIARPIEFYSCFISYSHADKAFARRLYDALQGRGIRCWLDEHELLPGQKMHDEIDRGIRLWDKVLLCCSKASLSSWWVDKEVGHAFAKEERLYRERGEHVLALVPLNLDGHLFAGEWKSGFANDIKGRRAPDFTGWDTDNAKFEREFERVVKALRAGERPAPPRPLL